MNNEDKAYLKQCQSRVEKTLNAVLPKINKKPKELHKAMRYAALSGGKRLRSALIYATGDALGADKTILDRLSAAVEILHTFSIVHDDLPAIDNDDIRRGKPSCHIVFGEATAILAGDCLLVLVFEILANLDNKKVRPAIKLQIINELLHTAIELVRGEELDILMEGKNISIRELILTYHLKTGSLLSTCTSIGALAANCQDKKTLTNLKKFGDYIGLAFQIHDDIIGVESDTATLGKPKGSDELRRKPTYPSLLGIKAAKRKEKEALNKAMHYLKKSGIGKNKLMAIAKYIVERHY